MAAPNPNAALIAQLINAPSRLDRVNALNDSDYVFNFLKGTPGPGQAGFIRPATEANFPAALLGNAAMALGVLGPCGLNSPHIHPGASEFQIITQGGPVYSGFIMENGARVVQHIVNVGSATIFPQGAMHFEQNMGCAPTVFVSAFNSADPGTQQTAQSLFALGKGIVNATLGGIGMNFLSDVELPANVVIGTQECLDRCHIDRSTYNFNSTFAEFAAFSNSTWSMPAELPASVSSAYMTTSTNSPKPVGAVAGSASSSDIPFSQNPLGGAVIGLTVTSVLLLLACLGMLCMGFTRRRRQSAGGINPAFRASEARGYPYSTPYDETEAFSHRKSTEK